MFAGLLDHWPLAAASLVLAVVTQAVKKFLPPRGTRAGYAGRALLPILPVVLGAGAGAIPGMPYPFEPWSLAGVILYYAAAGVVSTWAFAVLKGLLRARGIDVDTLKRSTFPPPIPQSGDGGRTRNH